MTVFGAYSRYYNLLYKDKDYAREADYVHDLIQRHQPNARGLLDLGCGTGTHDHLLSHKGYEITGVDLSEEMLAEARAQGQKGLAPVDFQKGDIRSIRLGRTFDAVISLFHVMSYQVGNDDLRAALRTVREHLRPGGVLVFDFWYGPAVLTDRPTVRVKRLEDREIAVTRIAEPVMLPNDNVVEVNYQILVREKASGVVEELRETHAMRYLFLPEVELLLEKAGLEVVEAAEWLTGRSPGFDTWGVCVVARG